jgi:hypothetical protein
MKVILIDAVERQVKAVEITGDLDSIYQAMGVEMIEVATRLPNGDTIFVDEEGMIKGEIKGWFDVGAHQPFAGNGLVVGTSREGDTIACKSTVDDILNITSFPRASASA